MSTARPLYDRLLERFERCASGENVLNVTCARETERHLSTSLSDSLSPPDSLSRARVTLRTLRPSRAVVVSSDRPRWSDLASCLFWLRRRAWLPLAVASETIEGETAWRAWVQQANTVELLAVRDWAADDGGYAPTKSAPSTAPNEPLRPPQSSRAAVCTDTPRL